MSCKCPQRHIQFQKSSFKPSAEAVVAKFHKWTLEPNSLKTPMVPPGAPMVPPLYPWGTPGYLMWSEGSIRSFIRIGLEVLPYVEFFVIEVAFIKQQIYYWKNMVILKFMLPSFIFHF